MIFSGITSLFFGFIKTIVSFLPSSMGGPTVHFFSILGSAIDFFGASTFTIVISNIVFWSTAHLLWAIIEWIYVKIPGVN